ncbi:glucosyltransferase [Salmonella enterica subsp. enterica]|uniref:Glucosyltransferase n=1 Tax=Salmonella enterica I TaxID=59201 RepID=A0A447P3V6_SALET|nr:glucosyltransferase [Salmonella enterica subsp. enterica]
MILCVLLKPWRREVIRFVFILSHGEGECPDNFELIRVPVKSRTNHGRNAEYYAWVQHHLRDHPVDRVVWVQ